MGSTLTRNGVNADKEWPLVSGAGQRRRRLATKRCSSPECRRDVDAGGGKGGADAAKSTALEPSEVDRLLTGLDLQI
eukprot:1719980-Rhodomonas_salina.1